MKILRVSVDDLKQTDCPLCAGRNTVILTEDLWVCQACGSKWERFEVEYVDPFPGAFPNQWYWDDSDDELPF